MFRSLYCSLLLLLSLCSITFALTPEQRDLLRQVQLTDMQGEVILFLGEDADLTATGDEIIHKIYPTADRLEDRKHPPRSLIYRTARSNCSRAVWSLSFQHYISYPAYQQDLEGTGYEGLFPNLIWGLEEEGLLLFLALEELR